MRETIKRWEQNVAIGAFITSLFAGGMVIGGLAAYQIANKIPDTEIVQQGYAIPSKLEVKVQDLNNDGWDETILKYNGKAYLLMIDEQGKPVARKYEVKLAEVIPK